MAVKLLPEASTPTPSPRTGRCPNGTARANEEQNQGRQHGPSHHQQHDRANLCISLAWHLPPARAGLPRLGFWPSSRQGSQDASQSATGDGARATAALYKENTKLLGNGRAVPRRSQSNDGTHGISPGHVIPSDNGLGQLGALSHRWAPSRGWHNPTAKPRDLPPQPACLPMLPA